MPVKHSTTKSRSSTSRTSTMSKSITLSDGDEQVYGKITKALGNKRFECQCMDNITRIVSIRGSFSRRRKNQPTRPTYVTVGSWVLVSLRGELNRDSKGDIIILYTDHEVSQLKKDRLIMEFDEAKENNIIFDVLNDTDEEDAEQAKFDYEALRLKEASNTLSTVNWMEASDTDDE